MKSRRLLLKTLGLVVIATLTASCGDSAQVTARQIRDYISNVGSPDGRAQSTLIGGTPPAPSGGATPNVAIGSTTILVGTEVTATVSSGVPFATILLAVAGSEGYYQITYPEEGGSATILIGMSDDVPESALAFEFGVLYPDGRVSVYVGVPVTVNDEPVCGDGTCSGDETTETCVQDCPAEPVCGDGTCNGDETAETCSQDCQACTADSECEVTERCEERACRARVEGSPCAEDAQCPGVLYCSGGVCQDGTTGDLCDAQADCVNPNDLCDTTCRARLEGEDCGPGDACPGDLYCGPDDACHDGSTGDPCNTAADCVEATEACEGDPAVCTLVPDFCGNDRCDDDEDWNLCPDDCEDVCGDGVCDASEQDDAPGGASFCAEDCQVTVIIELDASSDPPGGGEGAFIVGNQPQFGDWTPNTIALLDDGAAPDLSAGDDLFTAAFRFDPGTSLEYKYTIGASGADWAGTEEFGGGNNRGYLVPSDGIGEVRISDVWAEQPETAGGQGSSTTVTVEAAACVFDESCDTARETAESCPSECGPCDADPCYEGVTCSVGDDGEADCGACPEGFEGDGFSCLRSCVDEECPGGGTQECNEVGECEPKDCRLGAPVPEGFCGTGDCFDGFCAEGVCEELCDEVYGPYEGPIGGWFCSSSGRCSLRMCTQSSDCGSVSECVEFEALDGRILNDLICESNDASRCSGNCAADEICYLETGCFRF